MSVKICSVGLSDVVVGSSGGGKTNIAKIVVGNADGTGTVLWQRSSPTPTVYGSWYGNIYGITVSYCSYEGNSTWYFGCGEEFYYLYFSERQWSIDGDFVQFGDGTEKRLTNSGLDIDLTWHEQ